MQPKLRVWEINNQFWEDLIRMSPEGSTFSPLSNPDFLQNFQKLQCEFRYYHQNLYQIPKVIGILALVIVKKDKLINFAFIF